MSITTSHDGQPTDSSTPLDATAAPPSTLLIDAGDLPSLVACALESDPSRVRLWHRPELDSTPAGAGTRNGAAGGRRSALVHRHAEALGLAAPLAGAARPPAQFASYLPASAEFVRTEDSSRLAETLDLVEACAAAVALGCHRVVWPVVTGPDHLGLSAAVERGALAAGLVAYHPAEVELTVDLPVADLTDAALVDLAGDLGVPARGFWPCEDEADEPCAACPSCRRWLRAFAEAGVEWPWAAVAAAG